MRSQNLHGSGGTHPDKYQHLGQPACFTTHCLVALLPLTAPTLRRGFPGNKLRLACSHLEAAVK